MIALILTVCGLANCVFAFANYRNARTNRKNAEANVQWAQENIEIYKVVKAALRDAGYARYGLGVSQ